ncbi:Cupin 2 conserved barrel domain protein [Caldithrix abyssi DSM 13497]|uniref:Cupin 2 conserved barrel domain protein n=1 Tax=Caldithrix abyssi DSM 13497 TaxID=880073 RepID=H1XQU4_CALAY|nr:cupin domain-containing protein [Caldithrix abyssi]APF18356.1 Cupin domain-containing protein [Caldithrix abyssi DSM 13497]EHO42367.1 Cupin 2 conserved barrel domain protein [Caldithrix abyssi DSM 13497]
MDRRKFIQTSVLSAVSVLMPAIAVSNQFFKKESSLNVVNPKIIKEKEGEILNVLGDIQTHKFAGNETGNQIVDWVSDVEPGVGIPPHIHSQEDEIFRVIEGQVEMMIDGKTTVLQAGDTAFAPKNIVHAWKVVGTEKAKMIVSAFPAGIEIMFRELAALPPGPPDFEKVTKICGKYGITFVK